MEIKVIKTHVDAVLPCYAHEGDAGLDLYATSDVELVSGVVTFVSTGIAIALPSGYEAQIRSRSGLAAKGVSVLNSPGTIDSGYRGEIKVILFNHTTKSICIKKWDRIAQMVVAPVTRVILNEVDELDSTERGSGGFGSTGK